MEDVAHRGGDSRKDGTVGSVATSEEAVDAGASIISVCGVDGAEPKHSVIEGLEILDGRSVCKVANILARDNKALEEVRRLGFVATWESNGTERNQRTLKYNSVAISNT